MKSFSLKKQILIIFLIAAVIPICLVSAVSLHMVRNKMMLSEVESQNQIMRLTSSAITQKLDYFNDLTKSVYYYDEIMDYLEKYTTELPTSTVRARMKNTVDSIMRTDDDILALYLLTLSGGKLFWNDGYDNNVLTYAMNDQFMEMIYQGNGKGVFSSPVLGKTLRRYPRTGATVLYGRLIKSISDHFEPLGILIIEVDTSCFDDVAEISGFTSDANILLVNDQSDVLWTYSDTSFPYSAGSHFDQDLLPDPSVPYQRLSFNRRNYYLFRSTIAESGYTCYSFLPVSMIDQKYVLLYANSAFIIFAALFFLCIVFYLLIRYYIRPIQKLSITMNERNYSDQFPEYMHVRLNNEISNLYQSFHQLNERTDDLITQLTDAAKTVNVQQLKLLRAQLNPHFLYNTLDTVSWMAQNGQEENIPVIIYSLSQILRYSIKNYTEFVPLSEELRWLGHYLNIQTYRFRDLFVLDCNVDESCKSCCVPRFILQPFIENAILHGFSDMHTGGHIVLSAFEDKNDLLIVIEDNGKGIETSSISSILYGKQSGIGISNMHSFLEQRFGTPYGIQIQPGNVNGTRIIIRMPLLAQDKEVST